ncbi:MAG: hypothetical protein IJY36_04360 [Coprobacter sp.]|nr:hypothetical protein [Coprobacter sp.]
MLTNQAFLEKILDSFKSFIFIGTSRSTAKLKPLHGAIAQDIAERLGKNYLVKSQGYGDDREASIKGRYVEKMVDITIKDKNSQKDVAGIAVKFVMQNYSQNSNNYFENMLGETANIRTANCPYFQIFIILDRLPYYKNSGELSKWEEFTDHNISKYCRLSYDDVNCFFHTPNKTLIYVVHPQPEVNEAIVDTKQDYLRHYRRNIPTMVLSRHKYPSIAPDGAVILNDYENFINKVYHTIMAK